ncbi:MAG: methionyl-tRNA formyltransferase [Actinomycetota bacterium]
MKVLFCGSPKSAIPILEAINNSKHELVGVVTQSAKPKGRDKKLSKTDVALFCLNHNIKFYETNNIEELFFNEFNNLEFDIAIVVAFGQIVPAQLLDKPKYGWINLHYSLLPKLRGAAPVQWSILNNDLETGVTWFQIDKGLDTGPILLQKKISINDENYEELLNKLNEMASKDLENLLDDIQSHKVQKIKQFGETSFAPKISEYDLKIDWSLGIEKIKAKIKIGNDYYSAWTLFQGNKIKILNFLGTDQEKLNPGQIKIRSKNVLVGTPTSSLILGEVIPQGKKRMPAFDWLNGVQVKDNLNFE